MKTIDINNEEILVKSITTAGLNEPILCLLSLCDSVCVVEIHCKKR